MLSETRWTVKVEGPAEDALWKLAPALRATFVVVLEELSIDPYVEIGGANWRETKPFQQLRRVGFDIRILKARQVQDWRIFYFVDERRHTVLVKEIVRRDDATYSITAEHVRRLKTNFRMYQGRR